MEVGKIPPHDIEAEQAILGCMLIDQDATSDAIEVLVSLGFNQSDAATVVSRLDPSMSVDDMIRKGLQALSANL